MNPADKGEINAKFYSRSNKSSVQPMKARQKENFIPIPKIFNPANEGKRNGESKVINPADKGEINSEFFSISNKSSVQPMKARQKDDPKSHQSGR